MIYTSSDYFRSIRSSNCIWDDPRKITWNPFNCKWIFFIVGLIWKIAFLRPDATRILFLVDYSIKKDICRVLLHFVQYTQRKCLSKLCVLKNNNNNNAHTTFSQAFVKFLLLKTSRRNTSCAIDLLVVGKWNVAKMDGKTSAVVRRLKFISKISSSCNYLQHYAANWFSRTLVVVELFCYFTKMKQSHVLFF